jgi:hypothetical protein
MRSPLHSAALIETWFDTLAPTQEAVARELQRLVLEAAPQLAQAIKWGNLLFVHERAHALAIVAHKDHCNLQVFGGGRLAAQFPALEGSGKDMRHLKVRHGQPVDAALVRAVVGAWMASNH